MGGVDRYKRLSSKRRYDNTSRHFSLYLEEAAA